MQRNFITTQKRKRRKILKNKCDASAELYSEKDLGDRIINHIGKFIDTNECAKCKDFMCDDFCELVGYGIDNIIDEYNEQVSKEKESGKEDYDQPWPVNGKEM